MGVSQDNNSDIEVAMAGGSTFEQRVAELAAAKQSLMDAYSDLGLGQSAKVAYASAHEAQAKAEKAAADAKTSAEAIITRANNEAQSIIHAAKVKADEARRSGFGEADAKKAEADKALAEARDLQAKAIADASAAAKAKSEMDLIAKRLLDGEAKAEEAAAFRNAEAEKLKALRDQVASALAMISKGV